jgi:hypothetical protein
MLSAIMGDAVMRCLMPLSSSTNSQNLGCGTSYLLFPVHVPSCAEDFSVPGLGNTEISISGLSSTTTPVPLMACKAPSFGAPKKLLRALSCQRPADQKPIQSLAQGMIQQHADTEDKDSAPKHSQSSPTLHGDTYMQSFPNNLAFIQAVSFQHCNPVLRRSEQPVPQSERPASRRNLYP